MLSFPRLGVNGFVAPPWLRECKTSGFHLRVPFNLRDWDANPGWVAATVQEASTAGVAILPILFWAVGDKWRVPRSQEQHLRWTEFCGHVAEVFAASEQPHNFEIWNEPNYHSFWDTGAAAGVDGYCDLVAAPARRAIKAKLPDALIICGGLSFGNRRRTQDGRVLITGRDAAEFIKSISERGKGRLFGAYSIHPYGKTDPTTHTRVANQKQSALKAHAEYARCRKLTKKPLLVTETGRSTKEGFSEIQQRGFLIGLMNGGPVGTDAACVANWPMLDPAPQISLPSYYWSGLFHHDGKPKLAGTWWRGQAATPTKARL